MLDKLRVGEPYDPVLDDRVTNRDLIRERTGDDGLDGAAREEATHLREPRTVYRYRYRVRYRVTPPRCLLCLLGNDGRIYSGIGAFARLTTL